MKKTIILSMLIFSAFTLFSEEQYNFRKVKFGMSFEDVIKSENIKPIKKEKDKSLNYEDYFDKVKMKYSYHFYKGKLVWIGISFDNIFSSDKNNYYENYNRIKQYFVEKYGKPTKSEIMWINKEFKNNPAKINEAISKNHVMIKDFWETESIILIMGIISSPDKIEIILSNN